MNSTIAVPVNQNSRRFRHLVADYGIVIAFFVLCIGLSVANDNFLSWGNWVNILRQTSINGILAIGMTYVILTKGIDLSVGSVLAFGGLVTASLVTGADPHNAFLSMLAGLTVGLLLGAINGAIVARLAVAPFVVTLGMLSVARGLTFIYNDGMPIANLSPQFRFIGQGMLGGIPVPVIITAYSDRTFTFITKSTPATTLLKKAAGISSGSKRPNTEKVGKVTRKQLEEIAKAKEPDLTAADLDAAVRTIAGSARSMGLVVEG